MYDIYDIEWDVEIDLVFEDEEDLINFALKLLEGDFTIEDF